MGLQIDTAQNVGVEYETASVGDRILAQLIDYALYFLWILAVAGLTALLAEDDGGESTVWYVIGGIMLPIMFCPLLCEYFLNGQTLGKLALKIKVVSMDGSKATLGAYLLRWLMNIIDISLFSGVVAMITIIVNGKGQRLGDIAAGTTVVKINPSIKLSDILHNELPIDYQPVYPNAGQLSDKDVRTIKKVLLSDNPELILATSAKLQELLDARYIGPDEEFLNIILNDYHYFANQETV
ncbi:hypothetical protein DYBT9275_04020 [Dyadobacter sp. CECT 9275]|uniref:RDD domain-containing protein n=1 Tax=Dyadobacter helix TaxID=2822344 RepID=A0A916NML4_9BACT|nr:RDD family protein [Dyadobacter sp. CECT 9275]CAG5007319.1 hypothetical protein DYBT9275_04020 [Dyadobacter sp. CECT 9275]